MKLLSRCVRTETMVLPYYKIRSVYFMQRNAPCLVIKSFGEEHGTIISYPTPEERNRARASLLNAMEKYYEQEHDTEIA